RRPRPGGALRAARIGPARLRRRDPAALAAPARGAVAARRARLVGGRDGRPARRLGRCGQQRAAARPRPPREERPGPPTPAPRRRRGPAAARAPRPRACGRAGEGAARDRLVALLREEAVLSMPPLPGWYRGRDPIRRFFAWAWPAAGGGPFRLVPAAANRQPA